MKPNERGTRDCSQSVLSRSRVLVSRPGLESRFPPHCSVRFLSPYSRSPRSLLSLFFLLLLLHHLLLLLFLFLFFCFSLVSHTAVVHVQSLYRARGRAAAASAPLSTGLCTMHAAQSKSSLFIKFEVLARRITASQESLAGMASLASRSAAHIPVYTRKEVVPTCS